jgi:TPR repeat protein
MQKLLVWLGIVVVVASVVAGFYLWSGREGWMKSTGVSPVDVVSPMNPLGRSRDPNDPGEIHFRHGRYPEAIAYWTAEAAKGNPQAAHRLGVEYQDGKPGVVQRDYAKAMQYHRQAALAGNALSMFDLGSIYEHGLGIPKDIVQSAVWYGHSARYGLAQGQYNFATMLETGDGIAQDMIEAYKFFILAARGGFTGVPYDRRRYLIDKNAPLPTQLLEQKLSREQVAEGRQRADAFQRQIGPLKSE